MKTKPIIVLSICFTFLGSLFLIVGIIFNIKHWFDMFQGIYSGPFFIIIGLGLLIGSIAKSREKYKE
jgi:hypothetical protein